MLSKIVLRGMLAALGFLWLNHAGAGCLLDSETHTTKYSKPTVNITAPANGAVYLAPAGFSVSISAADGLADDPGISKVELYRNGSLVASQAFSATPVTWTVPVSGLAAGSYAYSAIAYPLCGPSKANIGLPSGPYESWQSLTSIKTLVSATPRHP